MSPSTRYQEMSKELDIIRSSLLPIEFNPLGQYSEKEIAQARAFVVLAHAEFESYIEDRVKWCAASAIKLWTSNGIVTLALVHLSLYLSSELKEDFKWKNANAKFEAILGLQMGKIQNNHGVKNANLKILLKPIGIDLIDIPVLAPELESFGASRGSVAHSSGSAQTTSEINPNNQYDIVFKKILPELEALDIMISEKCLPNHVVTVPATWIVRLFNRLFR